MIALQKRAGRNTLLSFLLKQNDSKERERLKDEGVELYRYWNIIFVRLQLLQKN